VSNGSAFSSGVPGKETHRESAKLVGLIVLLSVLNKGQFSLVGFMFG
jgi:hypothetical protein